MKSLKTNFCIKVKKILTFSSFSTVASYSSVASFSSITLLVSVLESLKCQRKKRTKMVEIGRGKNNFNNCRKELQGEFKPQTKKCNKHMSTEPLQHLPSVMVILPVVYRYSVAICFNSVVLSVSRIQ